MTYRSMLVALDATPANLARVNIAIALAKSFEAHLIGLAPSGAIELQGLLAAAAMDAEVARATELLSAQARSLAQDFDQRCRAAGLASFEGVPDSMPTVESLAWHSQCTDLLILSQPDPSLPAHRQHVDVLEQVLLQSARPALLIPYTHREPLRLQRVLATWDGSRESVRALTDARPLLRRAQTVALTHWRREAEAGVSPRDRLNSMRQWLAFQGVDAEARDEITPLAIGDAMLNGASDMGADLIVMGAYGHSRWSERLFGGVSRTLLGSMTVPVLMSH